MNITVICTGRLKEKYLTAAADEYKKRISRYGRLDIIELPDEKIPKNASAKEEERILEKEGAAVLSKMPPGAMVCALCIEGEPVSSEDIAGIMKDASMSGRPLTLIIGSSLGLCEAVKKRADKRLSFGRITLPHQLMRVVLLEQLYRGYKILAGETYHK